MYVYIKSETFLWTVGFYSPMGEWNAESDHDTREKAVERVHYLNGGENSPMPQYMYEASLKLWEECNKIQFPLDIKPNELVIAMGDVMKAIAKSEGK